MDKIVIVESPAKAETIRRYLGDGWRVLASYGHVRDLLPKDGSVRPDEDFAMTWSTDSRGEKRIREIASALGKGSELWLATDPDREGEAISWHLVEELERRGKLGKDSWKRVTFNEITRDAIQEAFARPRTIDKNLVDAYLARRALDYLFGFSLSPVLWRKLPGSRSAGRVQSVALRIICDREDEIEKFIPVPYWSVTAKLAAQGKEFTARPETWQGKKVPPRGFDAEQDAKAVAKALNSLDTITVESLEVKEESRKPKPPFTTSTLQQEASRRLGLSVVQTMRLAQRLYEGVSLGSESSGLITYMRTDSTQISGSAIAALRETIEKTYGTEYLPKSPRQWKKKARNAQEAHEAIRPTNFSRNPDSVAKRLQADELALYRLIWQRALAGQMAEARLERTTATLTSDKFDGSLRAVGTVVVFDGFLRLWKERIPATSDSGKDEDREDEKDNSQELILPPLREKDRVEVRGAESKHHETKPPARYTEASLVKILEERGIGRPSTYAPTLQVLRDRSYVSMEGRAFVPDDRGRIVVAFLKEYFPDYVEHDFTAKMEEELDAISLGSRQWREPLSEFWRDFSSVVDGLSDVRTREVIDALDKALGGHFFPRDENEPNKDPRLCPNCGGRLGIKLGRTGGFIGCSNYPTCRHTKSLGIGGDDGLPLELGTDPETKLEISVRNGPFGPYIQLGEAEGDKKPKRVGLPKGRDPSALSKEEALGFLSLPRTLGEHEGEKVTAGIGRFGPWVKKGKTFASVPRDEDVLAVGLNRAVTLVEEKLKRGPGGRGGKVLRELGEHPEGGAIAVMEGRYGAYVKHGKINATLTAEFSPDTVTIEQAVELIAARAARAARKGTGKKATKKTTGKKAPKKTAKKAATKKTAKKTAKKATAKKATAKTTAKKTSTKDAITAEAPEATEGIEATEAVADATKKTA